MAAVSGTISTTTFDTQKVIDHAFRRCRLKAEQITSEWQSNARELLYLYLTSLANQGVPLWCQEYQIIALYEGQAAITMPLGTVDVRVVNERTMTRLTGTYTSTGGGTASLAFDNDFETRLTQTTTSGYVNIDFGSDTQVTTVGLLPGATGTLAVAFQRSEDLSAWTTIRMVSAQTYTDNEWEWFDLDGNQANQYFRLNTSAGTLDMREIFVGNNSTEIPMARQNIDQYWALTNKTFQGQPLQYFFDRVLNSNAQDQPIMYIWPVTNTASRYDQITLKRHRYIMDVGTLTQAIEAPPRWYNAIVWGLAKMIAEEMPLNMVPIDVQGIIKLEHSEALNEAQAEERDNSPVLFGTNVSYYTV